MPSLSFSAVEVLPALLNHKKVQTIRPLWKITDDNKVFKYKAKPKIPMVENKIPRLKVGDITVLYWKMRSSPKDSYFCKKCGKIIYGSPHIIFNLHYQCGDEFFPKLLGKVKITSVFEIEMRKTNSVFKFEIETNHFTKGINKGKYNWYLPTHESIIELAKRDGFKSPLEMFKWFDQHYDLSQPKRFATYRWRWI